MIRRETTGPDGPSWLLISQVEHARLAYAAAREWGEEPYFLSEPRAEFLAAVACHDDGWALWEQRQPIDVSTGTPIQFHEASTGEVLPIWTRSIEVCRQIGPLAGALVAGHFLSLIALYHKTPVGSDALAVEDFKERFEDARTHWLADWADQRPGSTADSLRRAEQAQKQLRFFDLLSLWLCMAERTEPHELPAPDGPPVKFTPRGENSFTLAPWPFVVPQVTLRVVGRLVPARPYASGDELSLAPGRQVDLHFRLSPEM